MDNRLASLDVYRGLVLALMMGEALHFCGIAAARPASAVWAFLCHHQDHVAWVGGSLHDMIQPGFSFLVGAALPFSIAARAARGESGLRVAAHALRRGLVLVVLGIVLRSLGKPRTYFTLEDTLTQIGLGYPLLVLLALRPRREQWAALLLILLAFWGAFALYPAPGPGFDWQSVGVPPDWAHHLSGFAAHWNKNENFSAQFDRWFLNLFPRETPFVFNGGGYQTLSFVPTLATMILGLLAGSVLRAERPEGEKRRFLLVAGVSGVALGWLLGALGICPVVKRIWTPSWALWSGGFCFLLTAFFHELVDVRGRKAWAFPLVVLGTNSIAAYCLYEAALRPIEGAVARHAPLAALDALGPVYGPTAVGALALLVIFAILLWMQRRRIFLRI